MKKQTQKKERAIGYALSLLCIQEVGIGLDEDLFIIRKIVRDIKDLCFKETKIKLTSYPVEFLKENKELLKNKKLPYTLIKIFEDNKQ